MAPGEAAVVELQQRILLDSDCVAFSQKYSFVQTCQQLCQDSGCSVAQSSACWWGSPARNENETCPQYCKAPASSTHHKYALSTPRQNTIWSTLLASFNGLSINYRSLYSGDILVIGRTLECSNRDHSPLKCGADSAATTRLSCKSRVCRPSFSLLCRLVRRRDLGFWGALPSRGRLPFLCHSRPKCDAFAAPTPNACRDARACMYSALQAGTRQRSKEA